MAFITNKPLFSAITPLPALAFKKAMAPITVLFSNAGTRVFIFDSFFKFTIDKKLIETTALEEITEITSKFLKPNIYCMPLGENKLNISFNAEYVFKFCMKHGFNYSDRLHIRIFDTERGV